MINDQIARILQSKPDSLLLAVEQTNQQMFHLESLLEDRGKQIAYMQTILSSEMGLVEKVINAKNSLSDFQKTVGEVSIELKNLKEYVKSTIQKSHLEIISEIAKVFKGLCMDKKQRQEEIQLLKKQIQRLTQDVKLKSSNIILGHNQLQYQQEIKSSQFPIFDNTSGGYTLGSSSLKQLFIPINQQLLNIHKLKNLKQHSYEGNLNKNLKQGKGEIIYENEYSYKGSFRSGFRHGFGQLKYKDQTVYRGEWKKDLFWGKGVLSLKLVETQYENAVSYMGNFQSAEFHGLGVLEFEDGARFTTQFSHGKISSAGILKTHDEMCMMEYKCQSSDVICK